jgi:phage tail protein X
MADIYRTQAGDMIDEICWLYYGRSRGTVEAVLAANPGLCEQPLILPAGVHITLPTIEANDAQPSVVKTPWSD